VRHYLTFIDYLTLEICFPPTLTHFFNLSSIKFWQKRRRWNYFLYSYYVVEYQVSSNVWATLYTIIDFRLWFLLPTYICKFHWHITSYLLGINSSSERIGIVRFEIIMAMSVKKAVLWYVTPCSLVDIQDDSGGDDNTLGDDSNCHCKKQSSYRHV
jgi:hypothetical protein